MLSHSLAQEQFSALALRVLRARGRVPFHEGAGVNLKVVPALKRLVSVEVDVAVAVCLQVSQAERLVPTLQRDQEAAPSSGCKKHGGGAPIKQSAEESSRQKKPEVDTRRHPQRSVLQPRTTGNTSKDICPPMLYLRPK